MNAQKDDVAASIARAKADLEQALADLERIPAFDPGALSFAAHALYNYLNVAAGSVELLRTNLADHPDPEVHVWLDGLAHATRLMLVTTHQLMGFAADGRPELLRDRIELATLVQRACDYYQKVAARKEICIFFECASGPPAVWADRVAVAAIMDNLLSNAVKYSEPGKRVWVRVRREENQGVCSVRDEGPGIGPEDQTKLFQRGARLSARPTGGESSTGYGLAVARELARQLDGDVCCESRLGEGACFSLRLPLYREANKAAPSG